jgi:hypothetical protein
MTHAQQPQPYKTPQQRRAFGRSQRKLVRRVDQGQWSDSVRTGNQGPLALLAASMQGRVGRSQGCFAVSGNDIDHGLGLLGPGRLLFAAR